MKTKDNRKALLHPYIILKIQVCLNVQYLIPQHRDAKDEMLSKF